MSLRSIASTRFFTVALACAIGASAALAHTPSSIASGCSPACSYVEIADNDCPADKNFADVFCAEENPGTGCQSAGYCHMGLCFDDGGHYWFIECTEDGGQH